MYRILSIDGGGIKGIVPVVMMHRLEQAVPGWLERADLIAGTSTGGLIALGLAAGMSVDRLWDLYANRGEEIFDDSFLDNVKDVGKLIGADYHISNLERVLHEMFNEKKLGELEKKVLVASFDLNRIVKVAGQEVNAWGPKIFHNFQGGDSDAKELLYEVGCRTSAAPTYFETYGSYIDGGVFADNPSICALAQTQDERNTDPNPKLDDILLMSFGTGFSPTIKEGFDHDWGLAQWAMPLVSLMLDGMSGIADYQCKQLLRKRYCRADLVFNEIIKLDSYKQVPKMIEYAMAADITNAAKYLNEVWME